MTDSNRLFSNQTRVLVNNTKPNFRIRHSYHLNCWWITSSKDMTISAWTKKYTLNHFVKEIHWCLCKIIFRLFCKLCNCFSPSKMIGGDPLPIRKSVNFRVILGYAEKKSVLSNIKYSCAVLSLSQIDRFLCMLPNIFPHRPLPSLG